MSQLDSALFAKISHIVLEEHRPFSFLDFFPQFEFNGVLYPISHGTLRNKFLMLKRQGKIEIEYRSNQSFYTLKGMKFKRSRYDSPERMTSHHTVVSSVSSVSSSNFIDNLPFERHSVHDIRLRFKAEGVWSTITHTHPELIPNKVSKDISLLPIQTYYMEAKTIVHHSDTVSVIVSCPMKPVVVEHSGLIRLSNILTSVEERLLALVSGCEHMTQLSQICIPNHNSWIVKMWHFGTDSLSEYAGEKFEMTWEDGEHALVRIYTKDMKEGNGIKIRKERQEYPDIRLDAAIHEKLRT